MCETLGAIVYLSIGVAVGASVGTAVLDLIRMYRAEKALSNMKSRNREL